MRDNPGREELDLSKGVCRRCKKNSPSVLSCIGKRTREGCDRGSEVGNFTADVRRGRASSSINPAPKSRRFNVVKRFPTLLREVGRNGETIFNTVLTGDDLSSAA